jgi:phosphoglycolate phosphatase-like HAD superfamily hydrolase
LHPVLAEKAPEWEWKTVEKDSIMPESPYNRKVFMTTKVLLFDIDATLLLSGNAGGRALDRVFLDLYGVHGAFEHIQPHGKTDPMIFREIFKTRNPDVPPDPEMEKVTKCYLGYLKEELQDSPQYRVMPGVKPLLEALSNIQSLVLGLATGNLEPAAWLKLGRGGLDPYFQFGGFASDSEDRTELVRVAMERAGKHLGRRVPGEDIYVIGDTPRDIRCGKQAGARTVGVATGKSGVEELSSHGPDHVFEDFSNTQEAVDFFKSLCD